MPFKKQPYSWQKVKAGDIISFSYQSSRSTAKKVNCILVLNPKIPVTRKDGSNSFHMVGVKLKENQKPSIIFNSNIVSIFERIGEFVAFNFDDDIFKLNISESFILSEINILALSLQTEPKTYLTYSALPSII